MTNGKIGKQRNISISSSGSNYKYRYIQCDTNYRQSREQSAEREAIG